MIHIQNPTPRRLLMHCLIYRGMIQFCLASWPWYDRGTMWVSLVYHGHHPFFAEPWLWEPVSSPS